MELQNETIEQTQEPVVATVSKEEVPVVEWKAPANKDEFESAIKAAVNKANTEILKTLNVKSVKEFKELQAKLESERVNMESIIKERDTHANTVKELSAKYEKLQTEDLLNELNIEPDYREDLIKLAQDKVDDKNPLSAVLKEMVEGKYKYAISQPARIKMGTEKAHVEKVDEADEYLKKFKGTPYYKQKK